MNSVPKRFRVPFGSRILEELQIGPTHGIFFPDTGTYIIESEERGIDDFTGCPEDSDVEWVDPL